MSIPTWINRQTIGLLVVLALIVGAYSKGYAEAEAVWEHKVQAEQLRGTILQLQERDRISAIDERLTAKIEGLNANEKTIEKQVLKLVDRPVYHNVCLDADGVQLVEAARTGRPPADAGPSHATVPGPATIEGADRR